MIQAWKEAVVESAALYIGWGGLAIGIVFGFIVYRTNFCTMGSISDILSFGDSSGSSARTFARLDSDAAFQWSVSPSERGCRALPCGRSKVVRQGSRLAPTPTT